MNFPPIPRLTVDRPTWFPDPETALREPDGLLAWGGDLSAERLLAAYRQGIFPWFSAGEPPLWWSPDPRAVFDTGGVRLSSRLRRELRRSAWAVAFDGRFDAVVAACAQAPRPGQHGTWITPAMRGAYGRLHRLGHAHSVEVLEGDELVAGLYGVAVGRMFFAESMFSARTGGSKVALAGLARQLADWGWPLVDAQVWNPHLAFLGARTLPRADFLAGIRPLVAAEGRPGSWAATPPFPAIALAGPRPGA